MSSIRCLQKSCGQLRGLPCRNFLQIVFSNRSCFPSISAYPMVIQSPGVRHNFGKANKSAEKIPAYRIGVTKGQAVQHTGSLYGSHEPSERLMDDIMIRKYVQGVFYDILYSDVIIKRRGNQILINIILRQQIHKVHKVYFLVGFSEKVLSELFGCVTKFEVTSFNAIKGRKS